MGPTGFSGWKPIALGLQKNYLMQWSR